MDLLAAAANGVVDDADEPQSPKSSAVRDLLSEEFDTNSLFSDVGEDQDEVLEREPAAVYKGSPAKRVERQGDDDDDAEKESALANNTGARRGRSASPNTFTMPSAGDRVWIKYGNDDMEFFATVFYPNGWKKGEALLAFDDGDHHTFSKSDLKRCATAGHYAHVTEEHPLYGKGCVNGQESAPAVELLLNKCRGGGIKVDGVWIGRDGYAGKEKLPCYQTFAASDNSRAEFKSFLHGGVVRYCGDQLGVILRSLRCPLGAEERGARLILIVTPVAEACAGVMPCITTEFLRSATAWQVRAF